ncbi:MAG TPA: DUF72 domain-containing protein [Kofleriaceae bacterium]|nr:DUF72 domain-containing protein [Kofleriaceae bacterium]
MARAYIGTSGWVYAGWREHLYADTPTKRWLEVASRTFDALEINGSFYTQIKPETYARWRTETPEGFTFALKGHRFVTHYKRLRQCDESIERLRAQSEPLGDKLHAVIWQLPSNFGVDLARLDDFLRALRGWPGVRHALELRHKSWFTDEVAAHMRDENVAVCMGDAPDFPLWREVTSDLVYLRLHGHTRKYASSYSVPNLRAWAADIERWIGEGRDVHVYFDNDAEGHAVRNALTLRTILDGGTLPVPPPVEQYEWKRRIAPRPPPAWGPKRKPEVKVDAVSEPAAPARRARRAAAR